MASQGTLFVIIASALALGGCSSATLTSGANLAKAGQSAAVQMEQNATTSSTAMVSLRKAVAFNDGYHNQIGNLDSKTFLIKADEIQSKISQYAKMLESLASTYSALGDLASYDAVGSFNTSFATFDKDANTLLQSLHQPFPQETASAVQAGGGIVIGFIQAKKIKDASRIIKAKLQIIIPIMDNPDTKKLLILSKREITGQIAQAATTLFGRGVYSYGPLLDDLGAPLNLKSNSQSDAIVAKDVNSNPKFNNLSTGLQNVAIELANEQSDQMEASYDKSVAALKALVPLHESLENGAPLNLDTVLSITSQLQAIATSLQPAKAAKGK